MNEIGPVIQAVDIRKILESLPHRYPFLLVDRVHSMRGDEFAVGVKNVTINEPQFMGHFPGDPVFPGVLIIEGMAQTAGVLCIAGGTQGYSKQVFFLTIDKAKFRKLVRPGDTLEYHMTKKARRKNMWWYTGIAKVADEIVAEAEVGAMIIDS
jgi:3-hydroxyacyl-[acyl-carrier-protein] dehydratase